MAGGDAVEIAEISNTSGHDVQLQLSVELFEGPAPTYLKYVYFDYGAGTFSINQYDTQSGASYGHAIAQGATAVGAAPWYNTAAWGAPLWSNCKPACLEHFSSAGGVPIFFNTAGNRLGTPQVRQKLDQITRILEDTAKDMRLRAGRTIAPYPAGPGNGVGVDFDSGYGFVDAEAALGRVGN